MRQASPTSSFACLALLLSLVISGKTARAHADNGPVLLINVDAELIHAARTALTDANAVLSANDPTLADPTTTEAAQLARVRTLARDTHARMAVWARPSPAGADLQVFDARADALVATRQVPTALDAVAAAAVVLSIKTWLLQPAAAVVVAALPSTDEAAGSVESAVPPATAATPPEAAPASATSASLPPPVTASRVPTQTPQAAERALTSGAQPEQGRASMLELALSTGIARLEHAARVRFELGAAWWPARGFVGIELRAQAGPAFSQDMSVGGTRMFDGALALAVAARTRVSSRVSLAGTIGPGLHLLRLWGSLEPTKGVPVDVTRFVPALGLSVRGDYWFAPSIRIGLWVDCGWLLRVQRYSVDGMQVFQPERLRAGLGVSLGFALD